jgi:hypothetical protein
LARKSSAKRGAAAGTPRTPDGDKPEAPEPLKQDGGAEVVRLDRFRKK